MRAIAVMGALVVAGCFSPSPPAGGACADGDRCPAPLVCELATHTCVVDPTSPTDPDAATAGDDAGDDTSDPVDADPDGVPDNDLPTNAKDVSEGGTFEVDLSHATADLDGACGAPGGRDVFYEVTVPSPEVVYVDSFGSDLDIVIRVLVGPCAARSGELACLDDECELQAQGAGEVDGTICLVVDQARGARETVGHAVLTVFRGGRPGIELPAAAGTIDGSTDGQPNLTVPECRGDSGDAGDVGYYFTACPGETLGVYADTCTGTPYDSWLSLRAGRGTDGDELACLDDLADCGPEGDDAAVYDVITGPGLFWILVDGYAGARGDFQLAWEIQPP